MLYLIRHCSTADNDSKILCSDRDLELSDHGLKEANKLSWWFTDKRIDIILSSDSQRAKQTSSFISEATLAPVKEYSGLRDRRVGPEYSSLRLNELQTVRSARHQTFFDPTQDWNNVSEVEGDESVYLRTKNVLEKHIFPGTNIACVTHAGVIKSFLHSVFDLEDSRGNGFKVRNGCILVFQNENDFPHLQLVGMYQLQP
jgi:broad specificity phosphatase PhoE